jgi:plastocyanin
MACRLPTITLLTLATLSAITAGCDSGSRLTADRAPPTTGDSVTHHLAAPGNQTDAARALDPHEVVIDNFAFSPSTLTVAAGTTVTWLNRDDVPHTATSTNRPRLFDSRTLDTDQRFSHVFTTPGTYEYFCAVHPHMIGRIVVK